MTRISTWELNNLTVNSALNVQSQLAQKEVQQSSGLTAEDFGTLGGAQTGETLSLEGEIAQSQTWAADATTVGSTTQGMYDSIGSLATLVTQLQTTVAGAISSPTPTDVAPQIASLMTSMAGEMNTQIAGQYVFAGANSGVKPVDLSNYPALNGSAYDSSAVDTSYYKGDNTTLSVRVSPQQTLAYGVTANNTAFEESLRAAETALQSLNTGTVSSATVTGTTNESSATTPLGLTGSFAINGGENVSIVPSDNLTDIANAINAAAGSTGVTASVAGSGPYNLQIATSSGTSLTFTGQTGTALTSLGITPTSLPAATITSQLQTALGIAEKAETDLSNLRQSVATVSSQLQNVGQQQTTFVTYLQNNLSDLKDVNTGEVAAQVSQYQTQLQASYLAVADVTKVNLVQYL
jgi:flagellar hook-associated protein 3 FlgL